MNEKITTEYDIQALVDDHLAESEAQRVRALLQSDAQLQERFEELQSQKNLLNKWWVHKKRQF
jgi:anti-sigma factor RsiW